MATNKSGHLVLEDGHIRYLVGEAVIWQLPISSVRIIGEATTDYGPFVDDYFYCFAYDSNSWYEASFYAEGSAAFWTAMSQALQWEFKNQLIGSTDYDSNVLWPPHLAGTKMFTYESVPSSNWFCRLIGLGRVVQRFSATVLAELSD